VEDVKPRILIVEDEPAISDNIQFVLESEALETVRVGTGQDALPVLRDGRVDLIILDVGLPDISGFALLKEIRRAHATPIIMLTARTEEIDRVLGLELGADDYVAKPFSPRELAARVRAVLRRGPPTPGVPAMTGAGAPGPTTGAGAGAAGTAVPPAFLVNAAKRQILYFGVALELSRTEYELLARFIERRGHVLTREQLMSLAWEQPESSLDRTVDVHIKNLRAKLRGVRPDLEPIVTHRGSGYALRDDL